LTSEPVNKPGLWVRAMRETVEYTSRGAFWARLFARGFKC
jgi:hypothetical protein